MNDCLGRHGSDGNAKNSRIKTTRREGDTGRHLKKKDDESVRKSWRQRLIIPGNSACEPLACGGKFATSPDLLPTSWQNFAGGRHIPDAP
jgi:hypothetical protein